MNSTNNARRAARRNEHARRTAGKLDFAPLLRGGKVNGTQAQGAPALAIEAVCASVLGEVISWIALAQRCPPPPSAHSSSHRNSAPVSA
eukprot:7524205-Pyramimonas_sp.AAC.1